jgi:serine/threonine-protein kinase
VTEPNASIDSLQGVVAVGDVVADKYRIERVLGEGGMGVVVEAWHMHFDERVAIKFLIPDATDEEAIARFERESRVLFKLKNNHSCRVIDVGKLPSGAPYMVMEFLEGADLASRLVDREKQPIEEAVGYVLQACEALAEAHGAGIVHRDIKPENLFVTTHADGSPMVKVLDFGLSKLNAPSEDGRRERTLTQGAQAMGTPHYMSPEQWRSARDVGPASDQWSIATILYELIAGVPPFHSEKMAQLCTMVLRQEVTPLEHYVPSVPPELAAAVQRALRKAPDERFATIADFAAALAPFAPSWAHESAARAASVLERSSKRRLPADMAPTVQAAALRLDSDMSPTMPRLPDDALPPARNIPTAQSFSLNYEAPRSSRAKFMVLGAVAGLLIAAFAVVAFVGGGGSESAASSAPTSPTPAASAVVDVSVAEGEAPVMTPVA